MTRTLEQPLEGPAEPQGHSLRAALDLGSNSFHLLLVREDGSGFRTRETLKEKVQLLSGFTNGEIQPAAFERGLACIERFAQRIKSVSPEHICAMGTYALREATNAQSFLEAVSAQLGAPVEVISGAREAELIFAGVANALDVGNGVQLVIDIGGGSTELVQEVPGQSRGTFSLDMGCVAFKDRFFGEELTQASGFIAAREAATEALLAYRDQVATYDGTRSVWGTSGTIESIQTVLRANGWGWESITLEGMERLAEHIAAERWVIDAGIPGLPPDRVDIFPAGVAILAACFDVLGIEEMRFAATSLLHGIVATEFGAHHTTPSTGAAERSIERLMSTFAVDPRQARRVERTALKLFNTSESWWPDDETCRRLLSWAARVHEIGMCISTRHYHRHGAYVIKHAELPGISAEERAVLALLVRGHRRSLPGLAIRAFDPEKTELLLRLLVVLRIAVILERSHTDEDSPDAALFVEGSDMRLDCGPGWLARHPLSAAELNVEVEQLQTGGLNLKLN